MGTSIIRADAHGPYVRTGGHVFRPGAIRGYEQVLRMDAAGLVAGDRIKARHRGGTPLARLVLDDGTTTHWAEEATLEKDAVTAPPEADWLRDGRRDMRSAGRVDERNERLPREIEATIGLEQAITLGTASAS